MIQAPSDIRAARLAAGAAIVAAVISATSGIVTYVTAKQQVQAASAMQINQEKKVSYAKLLGVEQEAFMDFERSKEALVAAASKIPENADFLTKYNGLRDEDVKMSMLKSNETLAKLSLANGNVELLAPNSVSQPTKDLLNVYDKVIIDLQTVMYMGPSMKWKLSDVLTENFEKWEDERWRLRSAFLKEARADVT